MGNRSECIKMCVGGAGTNAINCMKELKWLLLGLPLFFFNICFVSCCNRKTEAVVQGDGILGCIGFTSEEGLPICLSFRHHTNGEAGRFSVVSVYDTKGRLVKEMSLEGYE